jgi:hypothetical protein
VSSPVVAVGRPALLRRRIRLLVAATITYNVIEAVVAITAGTIASEAVLVGLVLNATLGWCWADPVAALGLAVVAVREGRAALRGDTCCPPVHLDEEGDNARRDTTPGEHSEEGGCGCAAGCTGPCCTGRTR